MSDAHRPIEEFPPPSTVDAGFDRPSVDDPMALDVVRLYDSLERIADGLAGIAESINRLSDHVAECARLR